MTLLDLSPDQLLSTTRAVRKRLDLSREVPDDLIRECVELALQAPSGSNNVVMRFVVVTHPELRERIAAEYRVSFARYRAGQGRVEGDDPVARQNQRVADSSDYLAEHMGEAPALVIACAEGTSRESAQRNVGSVLPGAWSFMLAARARGLGTSWTTLHLPREREVADILGIPYDTVAQFVMTPVAYTLGTDFKPALRPAPDEVIHWNGW